MSIRFTFATLFPEMCRTVYEESIVGRALRAGKIEAECYNIRDYAGNKHNRVDDTTYGGGMGMLMQAQPIYACFEDICLHYRKRPYVIYPSPQGQVLTQRRAKELSQKNHIVFLCGHYEGVDQRVLDEIVDEEISIGDYVVTSGELAALTIMDCIARLCPGVLSDESCFTEESHYSGLLEYPQYSWPAIWRDKPVPEVLLSGHHQKIADWRRQQSLRRTLVKRPDMLARAALTDQDRAYLQQLRDEILKQTE